MVDRKDRKGLLAAAALLAAHFFLSLYAGTRLSPPWDEIAYAYTGYVHLTTGSLEASQQNTFLARLMYGAPLLFCDVEAPVTGNPWQDGFEFVYHQKKVSPHKILFLSRIPVAVFSVLLGLLLYLWARRVWGETGGMLTLLAYLITPAFLSRASVGLTEMPMYFFVVFAMWAHEQKRFFASAVLLALALLCKLTALPAVAALCALDIFRRRAKGLLWCSVMAGVFIAAYVPWHGGLAAMSRAVYAAFWFNKTVPYYFMGSMRAAAPGFISFIALLLKAPLFVVILGVWGFAVGWKRRECRPVLVPFLAVAGIYLLMSFVVGAPVSTTQLSPLYVSIVFACGALGTVIEQKKNKLIVAGLLLISAVDVYRIYPNQLAYFNWAAGGSENGSFWLGDSDQDWGQSLPALGNFVKKNPEALYFLSYSGAGEPEAYGIRYVDFFSPGLTSRSHRDLPLPNPGTEKKIFVAVGAKVFQAFEGAFAPLKFYRRPVAVLDQTIFVYDVSADAEMLGWMENFFQETKRPEKAAWCTARVKTLINTASRK